MAAHAASARTGSVWLCMPAGPIHAFTYDSGAPHRCSC
jgi:hypothetical protein